MSRISANDYLTAAFALRQTAANRHIPYVLGGMTLSGMDCQGLCEYLLIQCGIPRKECNLAGSNAHYRACEWVGTPEECRSRFGRIPPGAWLFILENDGREPVKYHGDNVGNASHMGVYLGAEEGTLHASVSRRGVSAGTFNGVSGSGGWNRVGLCKWVNYGLGEENAADGAGVADGEAAGPAALVDDGQVSTPDGNPVKLRARPSRRHSLYWKVPNGSAVTVEGLVEAEGYTWARVRYGDRKGYIMTNYLIVG